MSVPGPCSGCREKSRSCQRHLGFYVASFLLRGCRATLTSGDAWVGHWFSLPLGFHSPAFACLAFLHGCYRFQWCVLKHSRAAFAHGLQQVPRWVLHGGESLSWILGTARLSGSFHQSCWIGVQSHQQGMSGSPSSQGTAEGKSRGTRSGGDEKAASHR